MNNNDLFDKWIAYRKNIEVPRGFSSRVMVKIHEHEKIRNERKIGFVSSDIPFLIKRVIHFLCALAFSILGLYRISNVTMKLLLP